MNGPRCDVCLILEGSYPHVAGGVSTWTHELIRAQKHLTFHVVALTADASERPLAYEPPSNVVGLTVLPLHRKDVKPLNGKAVERLFSELEGPLKQFFATSDIGCFSDILTILRRHPIGKSVAALMNSRPLYTMLERMYQADLPGTSFLNYFWTWRSLLGGFFAVLLADLPEAGLYHAITTGYAGLLLARATIETGRAGVLTEHGIYTNERRIEITMAEWLASGLPQSLDFSRSRRDLRDIWIEVFSAYSRVCYAAASSITTLYQGNKLLQTHDGAVAARQRVIPNGVDYDALSKIERHSSDHPPTIALIGRVVPIKDVKTFIRTVAVLHDIFPDLRALVLGPADEDPLYGAECKALVARLGLGGVLVFTGRVTLKDYFPVIDVVMLTSISEAQPLVLLEAGAAGIPCVATDVGSCREIIQGRDDECPALGTGGALIPLADPEKAAEIVAGLLSDSAYRKRCGETMRSRVEAYYNKASIDRIYRDLYDSHLAMRSSAGLETA